MYDMRSSHAKLSPPSMLMSKAGVASIRLSVLSYYDTNSAVSFMVTSLLSGVCPI